MHMRQCGVIVVTYVTLLIVHMVLAIAAVCFTAGVYPNILSSSDSTRISAVIVLITWHTWFPDSFSPFILSKCSDSLQSVCFELSKRNQRHVSTWNKCYCKMSPAAHDMMNYNHMLISPSCSNGLFTWRSITDLLRLFYRYGFLNRQEYATVCSSYFVCFSASQDQLKMHLWGKMCLQWKINRVCSCDYNYFV